MFRDLYKQANDGIKGDRAILDKAFLQAAQPAKKKSPVVKYSFVGTVVAAVMVLGAVFANPSVFTNRSNEIGALEEPTEVATTSLATEAESGKIAIVSVAETDEAVEDEAPVNEAAVEKKITIRKRTTEQTAEQKIATAHIPSGSGGEQDSEVPDEEEPDGVGDYSVAVMSLDGGADTVLTEEATEEAMIGFSLRDRNTAKEATEEATEAADESADGIAVFSYMYDLSVYEGVTEGFKNTDVSPVTNSEDAVERAKNECTIEYDETKVYYDPIESMWKVSFSLELTDDESMVGNSQDVYMNSDGITQLIVYGE